jgi:acyl carrier protein
LRSKLPAFMLPHHLRFVAALPQFASGKLDRPALVQLAENVQAPPARANPSTAATQFGLADAVQRAVAEIWYDVLGGARNAGLDENFFDAGGDSLRLLSVHARLQERLGVSLSLMDMFENGTIRTLAAALRSARAS